MTRRPAAYTQSEADLICRAVPQLLDRLRRWQTGGYESTTVQVDRPEEYPMRTPDDVREQICRDAATDTDGNIARRHGVSRRTVVRIRKEHGVPTSYVPPAPAEKPPKPPKLASVPDLPPEPPAVLVEPPAPDPELEPTPPKDDPQSWQDSAACRGKPTAWFFPQQGGSGAKAEALCKVCPVRGECFEASMTRPPGTTGEREKFGIWGGVSELGRRRIRKGAVA